MSPKKIPLILMKLWDLIVISLIKMCTKFQQKIQEVPLLHAKPCLKNYIENPMGSKGIQGKLRVFTLFKG